MLDKMEIDSDDEFTKQWAANSKFFGKDAFKSVLKKQEKKVKIDNLMNIDSFQFYCSEKNDMIVDV